MALTKEHADAIANSTRLMVEAVGLDATVRAAPYFVKCQPPLMREAGENMLADDIEQNPEEVNQIIAGCLGMM